MQPEVRRNGLCRNVKNCLSWPFKKIGKGLSSYYRNHYKPARLDLFEEFRLGRVYLQFLTLLIDCGLTNAVLVYYIYFSLYLEQSKIREKYGKDFPFGKERCGNAEDGCKRLNDKIFYTQCVLMGFYYVLPLLVMLSASCFISREDGRDEYRTEVQRRQAAGYRSRFCCSPRAKRPITARSRCDFFKLTLSTSMIPCNFHLLTYLLIGGFRPMNLWCESALQASLVRNIFQAFLFICLIPLLSIVYSSRDQLLPSAGLSPDPSAALGHDVAAMPHTRTAIILYSTKVGYDILTVIRTVSNI